MNLFITILICSFALHLDCIYSKSVNYNFNIRYFNGAPDGVRKSILGVNGQFPGPTIRVQIGDFLTVRVTNNIQSNESTSIHWHGLEQYLTPFQDGPEQVTQCPIPYGSTQTYAFQLHQAGTYWWHSHHSYQYTEGCWGSFIVENMLDPHRLLYDDELIVTLNDWYHIPGKILADWHLSKESQGFPPIPNSGMINGVGQYNCIYANLQNQTCRSTTQRYPVFEVIKGKRYRVRVINTSAMASFIFSIDNHKLTTIEVDGVDTVVVSPVDQALLAPAQRYSFIVNINSEEDVHWIRAFIPGAFDFSPNINPYPLAFQKNISGILRYSYEDIPNFPNNILTSHEKPAQPLVVMQGRPATHMSVPFILPELPSRPTLVTPEQEIQTITSNQFNQKIQYEPLNSPNLPSTEPSPNPIILNEMDCRPFVDNNSIANGLAPSRFDQSITMNVIFRNISRGLIRGSFNNIVYQVGTKPVIYQVIKRERIPRSSHAINTQYGIGKVVQLIINSRDGRPHPFHLHGHTFYVVGLGQPDDGDYIEVQHKSKLILNGVRRDTISVPTRSWAVLRYYADNPGVWLFHCHNNWHFQAGLGAVFIEGGPAYVSKTFGTRVMESEGFEICQQAGISLP